MVKAVFVGDIYYGDRFPDQGLPPGSPGHPDHSLPPGWGGRPPRPDQGLPGGWNRPVDPGWGWGGGERPDQGLPGGGSSGNRPTPPIYHPGHPDHGLPAYPDQGLPGGGNIPGLPEQGLPPGETIPPEEVSPPTIPPEHDDDLVVAVRQPNSTEWKYTAYTVAPDQGQPAPAPTQHRRGR